MKILILQGSPRPKGNTAALTEEFRSYMEEHGHECSEVRLYGLDIHPCIACRKCQKDWEHPSCAWQDDLTPILDQILECDLLVLATPIYSWFCTAPMKAAVDRMVYALNKIYGAEKGPCLWAGKTIALISTCGYKEKFGTELWEEGIKRDCKHSGLKYGGLLAERHKNYNLPFMDEEKRQHTRDFAKKLIRQSVRSRGIKARDRLNGEEREKLSEEICRKIAASEFFLKAQTIMIYKAVRGEVQLTALEHAIEAAGKTAVYPLCVGEGKMAALHPRSENSWETGHYGIQEPNPEKSVEIRPEDIDLIICPCTAFDVQGNRLGMGAGYYDRFLPFCTKAHVIAAGFEEQKVETIPVDEWDQPMEAVFTETNIIGKVK